MRKHFTLTLLSLAFCCISYAQRTTVKGRIIDSTQQRGMAYATVSLVHEKDSTLVTFARADSSGYFTLPNIDKGSYLLSTSYVGYLPVWKKVEIAAGMEHVIADVNMTDLVTAQNVTVQAKRPPVTMNNDTLEFNTENFKTHPNAVVEDMLKKMPGVTVESDGTIKVNGQTVQKILVNGKEFFTGDPKMATKNLPADAVDKVQLFDKKSDQSEFTGIDDGNTTKTINLKLKKDRNNALFGKMYGSAGTNERYDGQANINRFNNEEQISLLAMGNNTNKQGFSIADAMNFSGALARGMRNGGGIVITGGSSSETGLPTTGMGQNQQGVATTYAGGINYNNNWNKKTDLNTSYTGSDMHLVTNRQSTTQNLAPTNSYIRKDNSETASDNTQHRINLALDQKIDSSFSIKFTPNITWQKTASNATSNYNSVSSKGVALNEGSTVNINNADAVNITNNILLRKRLAKKGRTLSGNLNNTYNHSQSSGRLNSNMLFYDENQMPVDSVISQINSRDAVTQTYGANVTYTEPIGKRSLLEVSSFGNISIGKSNKTTYDQNLGNGKYDLYNELLSNDFTSRYSYGGGGLNFRTNQKMFNATVGTSLQTAALQATNNTADVKIRQTFTDLLPNAAFQYLFSRFRNLKLDYYASTVQPSVTQLQPIADISDPLNVSSGNADLKRQYNHTLNINYFAVKPESGTNIRALLMVVASKDAIVNADSVKENGSRSSRPVNADGVYMVTGNFGYGFTVKKLKSRFDVGSSISYNRNVAFLNDERNLISNLAIGPNLSWNFSIDDVIDLRLSSRFSISKATYSLQPQANTNYLQQSYGGEMTNYLPWSLVVNNQFNYVLNSGRTSGFNTQVPLWNASIAKSFLKNKRAEVKLSVYDLLNKNIGITRTANQSAIVDQRYNVLNRYFTLGFTYSLNKSGLQTKGARIMVGPPM